MSGVTKRAKLVGHNGYKENAWVPAYDKDYVGIWMNWELNASGLWRSASFPNGQNFVAYREWLQFEGDLPQNPAQSTTTTEPPCHCSSFTALLGRGHDDGCEYFLWRQRNR